MPRTCQRAAELGLKIGLYGGSQETLSDMRANLCRDYPGLQIAFAHSPPYRPLTAEEDDEIVRAIADAGVDILFVGLGCPKQERWMLAHASQLTCPAVGAGAAFDFIAGTKSQAPLWLQNSGFEWLYRLVCEPRRLWRRYLYNNPRFIVWLALQLMREHRSARAIEEAEPSSSRTRAYAKEPIDEQ
jgi:N-acetylglucosaminyldiphosphoundecaprenol N-acetyl-beta-D-mannosaminyltransferase